MREPERGRGSLERGSSSGQGSPTYRGRSAEGAVGSTGGDRRVWLRLRHFCDDCGDVQASGGAAGGSGDSGYARRTKREVLLNKLYKLLSLLASYQQSLRDWRHRQFE
jgi:hypothetical protein